ncbi:hypothetical protein [Helicobacter trogontum]|uniref:hypothetical protein n=1 Tax=Helicobacter trogontum TaxID=50960 RepID=UPI000A462149|nr:hypothetical protein [Helicobacter trogontum]MDY5184953.1 hypothetical protein [Helicobacter trogontum]
MTRIIESKSHANTSINALPKTNGAISQSSHTTSALQHSRYRYRTKHRYTTI